MTDSYAVADIAGTSLAGGLVGWLIEGEVTNSYGMGTVSGDAFRHAGEVRGEVTGLQLFQDRD